MSFSWETATSFRRTREGNGRLHWSSFPFVLHDYREDLGHCQLSMKIEKTSNVALPDNGGRFPTPSAPHEAQGVWGSVDGLYFTPRRRYFFCASNRGVCRGKRRDSCAGSSEYLIPTLEMLQSIGAMHRSMHSVGPKTFRSLHQRGTNTGQREMMAKISARTGRATVCFR